MMTHYLQLKEKYKDCILFYRLGDFYEMFFEDAEKVSSLLDLVLTGKDCGLESRAPMCGIPFHAAENYIGKLVSLGEKVAICEQLSVPNGKGLVERDVIRIVTAGTIINNDLIDDKTNNFLGCVFVGGDSAAFSWADITTGEFLTKEFEGETAFNDLLDTMIKVSPAELISNSEAKETLKDCAVIKHGMLPQLYVCAESYFNYDFALNTLKEQFKVNSVHSLGLKDGENCVKSSGALLSYLKETQKHALSNITALTVNNYENAMMLDANAIRNLELVKTMRDGKRYGSLLWLLDKTKTSMGARKLQSWILSPLYSKGKIEYRLNGVKPFFDNTLIREEVCRLLNSVKDVGRILGKLSNDNIMPKDCLALANSLEIIPNLKFHLAGIESEYVKNIDERLLDFSNVVRVLQSAIDPECPNSLKDGGYIKAGYNAELDEFREYGKKGTQIIADIEKREREKTGIKNLKIGYNKVFGYYIEISNSFKNLAPYDYQRKQTLTTGERFTTDELKEVEVKILSSTEKALAAETRLYNEIKENLLKIIAELKDTGEALAELDVLTSLATVAKSNGYVMPVITESDKPLSIVAGRHPVVEQISKQKFIANDCYLDNGNNRMMIITGPNMAGKSTYMRQTALITIMAHIGSFVPADSAEIPLTDKIFTRVGASDNLILDQSTFMVEMTETADILANATKNSLLILDEIGRGTSTFDGLSIAWAVVEYIVNRIGAKTLFATHYHELSELEGIIDGVKNYKITVKEYQGSIVFLRKIMRGSANKSFGIEVAELAGINKDLTSRAKEILKKLEKKDITRNLPDNTDADETVRNDFSETENIIKGLDINNISPMQAFEILADLKEKLKNQ